MLLKFAPKPPQCDFRLFGFARLSEILKSCDKDFKGRLLIFFPGEFEHNHYRLLDARDGWDYLARPITL